MRKGFASAVAAVTAVTGLLALGLGLTLAPPQGSPQLFEAIGQAGIGLLIAFSVAVAAGERTLVERGTRDSHEDWLGFVVGVGVCALIGIGLAFGLAEHRRAGHQDLVDRLGLWWAVASVSLLGLIVALQPFMGYEWHKLPLRHRWRTERLRSEAPRSRGRAA
jgi:hypothetical protein